MKLFRLFFIPLVILGGMFTACSSGIKGNGTIITQNRSLPVFDEIKASRGIDVRISQAQTHEVEVRADENLAQYIVTEVEDGTLKVYYDQNVDPSDETKVYVSFTELRSIDVSSGADVKSTAMFYADELKVEASSGGNVELEIEAKLLICDLSSGADIELSGWTAFLKAETSSGSDLDAEELEAESASLDASSGSDMSVYVTDELKAKSSSGADISYKGKPVVSELNASSSSSIHRD